MRAAADGGAAGKLWADHQAVFEQARAHGRTEAQLVARGDVAQAAIVGTEQKADPRRIGERTDVAGQHRPRPHAHLAVAGEGVLAAGGQVRLHAQRQRRRIAVFAGQAHVRPQPHIAHRRLVVRREAGAAVARLIRRDGQVRAQPQAIEEHHVATDVHEQLMLHHRNLFVTRRVVQHQGLVPPVTGHSDGGAPVATQIEGLVREPIAAALGGIVLVQREPVGLSPRRDRDATNKTNEEQGGGAAKELHAGGIIP